MGQSKMFCYQCEQTAQGKGCTIAGVCGKSPEVANLQDLLVYLLRGVSQLKMETTKLGVKNEAASVFTCEALFATLTNVNFDPDSLIEYVQKAAEIREQLKKLVQGSGGTVETAGPVGLVLEKTREGLAAQGKLVGVLSDPNVDSDLHSLHWLLTYGLKGVAAYTYHAYLLGKKDDAVFNFVHEGLSAPLNKALGVNDFVGLAMKCGGNQPPRHGTSRRRKH
jgi:hydroxylamine reductase